MYACANMWAVAYFAQQEKIISMITHISKIFCSIKNNSMMLKVNPYLREKNVRSLLKKK